MDCYIGIDGGGTKTQYALVDVHGNVLNERVGMGSSHKQHGAEKVCRLLREEISALLAIDGSLSVKGVCFGMPCYGESGEEEELAVTEAISRALSPFRVCYKNDVEASWAGTFALLKRGIAILSGTGAMSLSRDAAGDIVRCGGWSEYFSDEGSCYWLGIETLRLFTRQADGRAARGPLYRVVREFFGLDNDYSLADIIHERYIGKREMVASLQLLLRDAAARGDAGCLRLYAAAAGELVELAMGLAPCFPGAESIPVSYAGGLFKSGDLILDPLKSELAKHPRMRLVEPLLGPVEGALLLAVEAFAPDRLATVRSGLLKHRKTGGTRA